MDHDSPSPPPSTPDDGADIVAIAYFFIFYFFLPLCFIFALIYYSMRDHIWELCCYYDAEAALESQQQPYAPPTTTTDLRATSRPSRPVIRIIPRRFTLHRNPSSNNNNLQPPPVGRFLRGSASSISAERIGEIAASCTECAICTGPLDEEDGGGGGGEACTMLPLCGHRFHKVCVYHWLNRKATCPICRRFYPFPVRPKFKILLGRKR